MPGYSAIAASDQSIAAFDGEMLVFLTLSDAAIIRYGFTRSLSGIIIADRTPASPAEMRLDVWKFTKNYFFLLLAI